MEALVSLVLLLTIIGGSDAAWCVCRSDMGSTSLQKTLDYACGAGADCNPIIQNGACYNPNTVLAHCSYATNSYYQRKGQAQGACDFAGTATLTSTDPSGNGCTYPAIPSAAGTSTSTPSSSTTPTTTPSSTPPSTFTPTTGTPGSTPPGTFTPATGTPGSTAPSTFTPTTGTPGSTTPGTFTPTSGGVLGGLGPSGNTSISTDTSDGGFPPMAGMGSLLHAIFFSCMVVLRV